MFSEKFWQYVTTEIIEKWIYCIGVEMWKYKLLSVAINYINKNWGNKNYYWYSSVIYLDAIERIRIMNCLYYNLAVKNYLQNFTAKT